MSKQSGIYIVLIALVLALTPPPANAQTGGTVVCWGGILSGNNNECNVPAGLSGITDLAVTYYSNLGLKSDGTVVAWGLRTYVPDGLTGVTAIAAGAQHNLALKSDGTVVCWRTVDQDWGQCSVPADLSGVTAIVAEQDYSLALKNDGTVVGWGFDHGSGAADVPADLAEVKAIAAGAYHSLALKSDGTVVAWGCDYGGWRQCNVPAGLSEVTAIAAGGYVSLALKSNGEVVAWGSGSYGQTAVPAGLTDVRAIAAGAFNSLALKSDGTMVIWGCANPGYDSGQCAVPTDLSGVNAIDAGMYHSLALTAPANWAPVAQDVTISTNENTSADVALIATDEDSSDTLTYFLVTPPQHGKLTLVPSASYDPDHSYTGEDTFQYCAYDGKALSNVAEGTVTVVPYNYPPVAVPDAVATTKGTKIIINVLANDSDPDEEVLTLQSATNGSNGKVTMNANGTVSYAPSKEFVGTDTFTYTISDGRGGTATATVTVTVTTR